jgi:cytochrome c
MRTVRRTTPQQGAALNLRLAAVLAVAAMVAAPAHAANADTAQDLAKSSGCFKCHGIDKKKDGPALRDAAAKFKGLADGPDKLTYHLTSGEMVKFPDGHEEAHKKVKSQDPKEIANLVQWILSLEGGTKY